MNKLIEQYLASGSIPFSTSDVKEYRCVLPLAADCRLKFCKATFRISDRRLHAVFAYPIRIHRSEYRQVNKGLAKINATMDDNEAFTLGVDGVIAYEFLAPIPETIVEVHSMLEGVLGSTMSVYEAPILEQLNNESKSAESKKPEHEPAARPTETSRRAKPVRQKRSTAERILNMIGLIDSEDYYGGEECDFI